MSGCPGWISAGSSRCGSGSRSVGRVGGLRSKVVMGWLVAGEVLGGLRAEPSAGTAVRVAVKSAGGRGVWLRPRSSDRAALEFVYWGITCRRAGWPGRWARLWCRGEHRVAGRGSAARPGGAGAGRRAGRRERGAGPAEPAHLGGRAWWWRRRCGRDERLALGWEADAWGREVLAGPHPAAVGWRRWMRWMRGGCWRGLPAGRRWITCWSISVGVVETLAPRGSGPGRDSVTGSRSRTITTRRSCGWRHWATRLWLQRAGLGRLRHRHPALTLTPTRTPAERSRALAMASARSSPGSSSEPSTRLVWVFASARHMHMQEVENVPTPGRRAASDDRQDVRGREPAPQPRG